MDSQRNSSSEPCKYYKCYRQARLNITPFPSSLCVTLCYLSIVGPLLLKLPYPNSPSCYNTWIQPLVQAGVQIRTILPPLLTPHCTTLPLVSFFAPLVFIYKTSLRYYLSLIQIPTACHELGQAHLSRGPLCPALPLKNILLL